MTMKSPSGMPIRILIADDHAVFRSALRVQLEKESDLKVVAEAGDSRQTLQAVDDNEVDVVLLDLSMPGMSGSEVAERLMREQAHLAIVVLTMHEDAYYVRELMRIGARAFVLKKSVGEDLLQAIRAAHRGERYVDSSLGGDVISSLIGRTENGKGGGLDRLTPREREVCGLLARGHTNTEIAAQISVSERKVERHRSSLMSKLGFTSRAELVRFAIENGLLKLD
jgi:DNA-binding NarL/FixJ family response regulator